MIFKNIDFLSPNITLYFYNQKRHSSCIGGLLTIIMIIICIYIIILYSFIKVYPSKSSLLLYRNYENDINIFFNKTGLFHYIWIYNEKLLTNNNIQNLINLNTLKRGIIRVYMTYSNKYDFNSSNLKDNEHWVYDTCTSYSYDEDIAYDYSYSYCIKYYYNTNDKKYYSLFDNNNFKWPLISQNITDFQNTYFSTFIEKCENNSILNEILGECYPENKINEYLYYFDHIFISFINGKIEVKDKKDPIKLNFHKIYDNLNNDDIYAHDLTFVPFNYRESKGLFSNKNEYSSFIFNDIKTYKLEHLKNKRLLKAYVFHSKRYIDEFIKTNNDIFKFLNDIGGSIFLVYILFYGFNLIINEKIKIRDFRLYLNEKENDMIQRHINYEKNNYNSFKSNLYTNLTNEMIYKNEGFNTYSGNFLRNDLPNLTNINNLANEDNIKPKNHTTNNNYTIKINRIDNDKNIRGKKSDNIIVINNNSFVNDNSNKKHNSKHSLEKKNSMRLINKYNNFDNLNEFHKTFTHNKSVNAAQAISNIKIIEKNNDFNSASIKKSHKKINDSSEYNSKIKIIDTSSVSLLNASINQNKYKNSILSSQNESEINNISMSNADKFVNQNLFSKLNIKTKDSPKFANENYVPKNNNYQNDLIKKEVNFENKENKQKKTFITFDNERRISQIPKINLKSENDLKDNYKKRKAKSRKTNIFLKLPGHKSGRHLSLFSKHSINNNKSENNLEKSHDNVISKKSFFEQDKKNTPIYSTIIKKNPKRQSSEYESKSIKKNRRNSIKNFNHQDSNNNFIKAIQNQNLSTKNICNYICLLNNKDNNFYMLNNFRQKLLSEELLYILHINMFIFKQRFGCKSNIEQNYLLEELYNDL